MLTGVLGAFRVREPSPFDQRFFATVSIIGHTSGWTFQFLGLGVIHQMIAVYLDYLGEVNDS